MSITVKMSKTSKLILSKCRRYSEKRSGALYFGAGPLPHPTHRTAVIFQKFQSVTPCASVNNRDGQRLSIDSSMDTNQTPSVRHSAGIDLNVEWQNEIQYENILAFAFC